MNTVPKINIAVVGNKKIGKGKMIRYWLALGPNKIVLSNIYTKMYWFNGKPCQISIYKFTEKNFLNSYLQSHVYQVIVYICNLTDDSVELWMTRMKKKITNLIYQCIILITSAAHSHNSNETMTIYKNKYQLDTYLFLWEKQSDWIRHLKKITWKAYHNLSKTKPKSNAHISIKSRPHKGPSKIHCFEDYFVPVGNCHNKSDSCKIS